MMHQSSLTKHLQKIRTTLVQNEQHGVTEFLSTQIGTRRKLFTFTKFETRENLSYLKNEPQNNISSTPVCNITAWCFPRFCSNKHWFINPVCKLDQSVQYHSKRGFHSTPSDCSEASLEHSDIYGENEDDIKQYAIFLEGNNNRHNIFPNLHLGRDKYVQISDKSEPDSVNHTILTIAEEPIENQERSVQKIDSEEEVHDIDLDGHEIDRDLQNMNKNEHEIDTEVHDLISDEEHHDPTHTDIDIDANLDLESRRQKRKHQRHSGIYVDYSHIDQATKLLSSQCGEHSKEASWLIFNIQSNQSSEPHLRLMHAIRTDDAPATVYTLEKGVLYELPKHGYMVKSGSSMASATEYVLESEKTINVFTILGDLIHSFFMTVIDNALLQAVQEQRNMHMLIFLPKEFCQNHIIEPCKKPRKGTARRKYKVLYSLLFDVEVVETVPGSWFYYETRCDAMDDDWCLVKFTLKKNLKALFPDERYLQFSNFISKFDQTITPKRTDLLSVIRCWNVSVAIQLIKAGYTHRTKARDLQPEELLYIFKLLIESPDFKSSEFREVMFPGTSESTADCNKVSKGKEPSNPTSYLSVQDKESASS